jgi:hypothetical protein
VTITDISTLTSDSISFQIPGQNTTYTAVAGMFSNENGRITWSGSILNNIGCVSFINENHLTAGFIQIGSSFYEITPINSTQNFFVERNTSIDVGCARPPDAHPIDPSPGCTIPSNIIGNDTCPALVSILLVITWEARDYILQNYGSVYYYALMARNTINVALFNSDIPNKEVRIEWIIADSNIQGEQLIGGISSDLFVTGSIISDAMAAHPADVGFLLTNEGYALNSTHFGGAPAATGPNIAFNYGIIEVPYVMPYYTLAHQWGHLVGCHHNWASNLGDNTDTELTCDRAKRWLPSPLGVVHYDSTVTYHIRSWHTIVGYRLPAGANSTYLVPDEIGNTFHATFLTDPVIPHYSNPNVFIPDQEYGNVPTGIGSSFDGHNADESMFIRTYACTVDAFDDTKELAVFFTYSPVCSTMPFHLDAQIIEHSTGLPGVAPYSVLWYWNETAVFPTGQNLFNHYLGGGTSITINEHPRCPVYWVMCMVLSADNIMVTYVRKIDLSNPSCECGHFVGGHGHREAAKGNTGMVVFPNPNDGTSITLSDLTKIGDVFQITIFDLSGREVFTQKDEAFNNEGLSVIHPISIPDGIYILRTTDLSSGFSQSVKLAIAQNR